MNILYIANDRRAAELAAFALGTATPDLTVAWSSDLAGARAWIEQHSGSALIVDFETEDAAAASVAQLRQLAATTPIVVVCPHEPAPAVAALEAAGAHLVVRDSSFLSDLPATLTRAVRSPRPDNRRRLRIGYVGDAALAREYFGKGAGPIDVLEAGRGADGKIDGVLAGSRPGAPAPFDVLLVEHGYPGVDVYGILKDLSARKLQLPVVLVAEWGEDLARLALKFGVVDYIVKSRASFRAFAFRVNRLLSQSSRRALEAKLADVEAGFQTRLAAAEAALEESRARHESELRQAAARSKDQDARVSQRQTELDSALTSERAQRQAVERQLHDMHAAFERAREQYTRDIADAAGRIDASERKFLEAIAELQRVEGQARAEQRAAGEQSARARDELGEALSQERRARQILEGQLADAERALAEAAATRQRADEQSALEASDAAAQLADEREHAETRLAQAAATLDATQRQLLEAVATRQQVEQRAADDRRSAAELAARTRTEYESALSEAAAEKQVLERQLADASDRLRSAEGSIAALEARTIETTANLTRVEAQLAAERQTTAEDAARQRADFERQLAEERAHRLTAEQTLDETASALKVAYEQLAASLTAAAAQAELSERQTQAELARVQSEAAAAVATVTEQATMAQQALVEQAGRRQLALENEIKQHVRRRDALERELAEARVAVQQAERRFVEEAAAMRQSAHEHELRLEERAASERSEWERSLTEARQSVTARDERIQQLDTAHREERTTFESARAVLAGHVERLTADLAAARSHADALVVAHTAELQDVTARHRAEHEAASSARADLEARLNATLAEQSREREFIAQLQATAAALDEELRSTRHQRDALQPEADRVPLLRGQLAEMQAEHRRQFDESPIALCVCRRGGIVTHVNQALASLLDYDSAAELFDAGFAEAVCASADELQWMADRSLALPSAGPTETTWTRKDGSRLIVRLRALPLPPDAVSIAVEDITSSRELEERLHHAQRMDAVARYASEVAATCEKLLAAVTQEAERWLAASETDATRRHGQWLLEEVARASGVIRQLAACGREQERAPEVVNLHKVLRDLQPVLKRIAGVDVRIVAPKTSTPLNLDVEHERVARILVNVAMYGRARMTKGGRLTVEIAPVILDHTFVSKYPHVRSGEHVLLTVSEDRRELRAVTPAGVSDEQLAAVGIPASSDSTGLDLTSLHALISDCAGHLWILAEPSGNMTLKIHLPRRPLDECVSGKRPARSGWLQRLSGARS